MNVRTLPPSSGITVRKVLTDNNSRYRSGTFADALGVIEHRRSRPSVNHRVIRNDGINPDEYAVGWMKRRPTGILGTNRRDAAQTVETLLQDAPALLAAGKTTRQRLDVLLGRSVRRHRAVAGDYRGGRRARTPYGRGRVKIADWRQLLDAARLPRTES
jgi:ferredoxin--NADP+ reductase